MMTDTVHTLRRGPRATSRGCREWLDRWFNPQSIAVSGSTGGSILKASTRRTDDLVMTTERFSNTYHNASTAPSPDVPADLASFMLAGDPVLGEAAELARILALAHQGAATQLIGEGWAHARKYFSLSEKYAEWVDYRAPAKGFGIQYDVLKAREHKRKPLPWVATGCRKQRMLRRGSPVRVRKRALQNSPAFSASRYEPLRWQRGPSGRLFHLCLSGGRCRRVARPGGGGRPARVRGGVAPHCAAGEPPPGQWPVG